MPGHFDFRSTTIDGTLDGKLLRNALANHGKSYLSYLTYLVVSKIFLECCNPNLGK